MGVSIKVPEPAHRQGFAVSAQANGVAGSLFQLYRVRQKELRRIRSPLGRLDLTGNRKKKGGGEQDK